MQLSSVLLNGPFIFVLANQGLLKGLNKHTMTDDYLPISGVIVSRMIDNEATHRWQHQLKITVDNISLKSSVAKPIELP